MNADKIPSPFDTILDAARAVLEGQRQELQEQAAKIKSATDAYLLAAEQALASDLARKLGVESPMGLSAQDAAERLRELVLALPELNVAEVVTAENLEPELPQPITPTPPVAEVVPLKSNLESYEAGPEARALWNELKALNLDAMPGALFKATAGELAARARVLQERGENAELIPERVIKKLTAVAGDRGIRGIYGLARHHEGDWADLARKAKAERERLQNGSNGLTQKLQIPATTLQKIADKPPSKPKQDKLDEGDEPEVISLPKLQAAAESKPVVLVGGLVVNEKLAWIARHYGFTPTWIETENGVKGVQSLEGRILDGNIAAVVILDGLISHRHFDPVVAATRQTGTPLAYGDTAGC